MRFSKIILSLSILSKTWSAFATPQSDQDFSASTEIAAIFGQVNLDSGNPIHATPALDIARSGTPIPNNHPYILDRESLHHSPLQMIPVEEAIEKNPEQCPASIIFNECESFKNWQEIQEKIYEIKKKHVNSKIILLLDLDWTSVREPMFFADINEFYSKREIFTTIQKEVENKIKERLAHKLAGEKFSKFFKNFKNSCLLAYSKKLKDLQPPAHYVPYHVPHHEDTPKILKDFQEKNIEIFGYTARAFDSNEWSRDEVQTLGIQLPTDKGFKIMDPLIFYENGIFHAPSKASGYPHALHYLIGQFANDHDFVTIHIDDNFSQLSDPTIDFLPHHSHPKSVTHYRIHVENHLINIKVTQEKLRRDMEQLQLIEKFEKYLDFIKPSNSKPDANENEIKN